MHMWYIKRIEKACHDIQLKWLSQIVPGPEQGIKTAI